MRQLKYLLLAGLSLAPAAASAQEIGEWGVDLAAMDPSVAPGDDFYRYVNGTWLRDFEIPPDFSNYGSFTRLFERSERQVRDIVESLAETPGQGDARRVGNYYAAFLDTDTIEARGLDPAQAGLERIAAAEDHRQILALMSDPSFLVPGPIGMFISVDARRPDRYVTEIFQGGLGLPNRDYYLLPSYADKADAYRDHIAQMLALGGSENAEREADAVFALERAIAGIHWPMARQRDPNATYNPVTRDGLEALAPDFDWDALLTGRGLAGEEEFVVGEKDAVARLASLVGETPVATWQAYLRFHYLSSYAAVLPERFDRAHFEFYGRTLAGTEEPRARWKRGVGAVDDALGEAVGRLYVQRHFPPRSRAIMEDLIENVRTAMRQRIDTLDWMSETTREEARQKLANFRAYIGYPDAWRDYSALRVERDDAFGNLQRAAASDWAYYLGRLGKPVEPGKEWGMLPHTVNAYYSPSRNAIYFPAAIMQPPFFDPDADPAVNFGGIGAVIGHEIGHGFDDQGRKQDGNGLLRDWWTPADAERFEERAQKLGAQYAEYEPLEGHFVDPHLTMGENVGDLGGLAIALQAWRLSLDGAEPPVLSGYTGVQRFYLSWAQVWRRKYREQDLLHRLVADPHSPSEYRANGVVRNMDDWYAAFDVKPENRMYLPPGERVSIW